MGNFGDETYKQHTCRQNISTLSSRYIDSINPGHSYRLSFTLALGRMKLTCRDGLPSGLGGFLRLARLHLCPSSTPSTN